MGFPIGFNDRRTPDEMFFLGDRKMKHSRYFTNFGRAWPAMALLASTLVYAGCSGLVDSAPSQPSAEHNVSAYYLQLDNTGNEYYYSVKQPSADKLTMTMKGDYLGQGYNGVETYDCHWNFTQSNKQEEWYFAVDSAAAFDLGSDAPWTGMPWADTEIWVDLKAPLSANASWTFNYEGDPIIATVTAYGVTVTIGNQHYNDVVQVQYTGKQNSGVKWFARGVGEIFESIDYSFGHMERSLDSCSIKS
jgi:hypothetical protein